MPGPGGQPGPWAEASTEPAHVPRTQGSCLLTFQDQDTRGRQDPWRLPHRQRGHARAASAAPCAWAPRAGPGPVTQSPRPPPLSSQDCVNPAPGPLPRPPAAHQGSAAVPPRPFLPETEPLPVVTATDATPVSPRTLALSPNRAGSWARPRAAWTVPCGCLPVPSLFPGTSCLNKHTLGHSIACVLSSP